MNVYDKIAQRIKVSTKELLRSIEEMERDGCQLGSDAIGYSLNELEELRQEWFKPYRRCSMCGSREHTWCGPHSEAEINGEIPF